MFTSLIASMYRYRPQANRVIEPIARLFIGVHPDVFTWAALASALIAGYFFFTGITVFLLLASLFVFLNGFLDVLDGAVARISNKATARGDFLDHVLDRYADIFIIGGLMFSPFVRDYLGFIAILGVLLTSYMGTQAHALIGAREYGGPLGRATRLLILTFAPLVQYMFLISGLVEPYGITFLEWIMVYFIIVGNAAAIWRAVTTWRRL